MDEANDLGDAGFADEHKFESLPDGSMERGADDEANPAIAWRRVVAPPLPGDDASITRSDAAQQASDSRRNAIALNADMMQAAARLGHCALVHKDDHDAAEAGEAEADGSDEETTCPWMLRSAPPPATATTRVVQRVGGRLSSAEFRQGLQLHQLRNSTLCRAFFRSSFTGRQCVREEAVGHDQLVNKILMPFGHQPPRFSSPSPSSGDDADAAMHE